MSKIKRLLSFIFETSTIFNTAEKDIRQCGGKTKGGRRFAYLHLTHQMCAKFKNVATLQCCNVALSTF